jgi:hypothetical protein
MATPCVTLYPSPIPLASPATGTSRSDIENKCIGVGLSLDDLRTWWGNIGGDHSCNDEFNRIIFGQPGGERRFSPAGFQQVMDDFDYLFSTFFVQGSGRNISVPGHIGFDPFQQVLIDACTNPDYSNQGVCQQAATKMCSSCSRDNISSNPSLLRLCGCQVPPLDPTIFGGITPECDPLCSQALISKKRNTVTGNVAECQSNICVISQVSINAAQSTVNGVNFTQVCPQCTTSQVCKCIIDVSIPTNTEVVGISDPTTFAQVCGVDAICLDIDPRTQAVSTVVCGDVIHPPVASKFNFPIPTWVWFVVGSVIILVLLILMAYSYAVKHERVDIPGQSRIVHDPLRTQQGMPLTSQNFEQHRAQLGLE